MAPEPQAVKKIQKDFFDSLKNAVTFARQAGQKSSLCSPHALLRKALRDIQFHPRRAYAPSSSPIVIFHK